MKYKWKQGMTAIALTSVMTLSLASVSAAASAPKAQEPIPGWASAEIAEWKGLGLLKGDENGYVLPNNGVLKTEFITFINRVFNFTEKSDRTFPDVPENAWYASEIAKAVASGALEGGTDGKISPLETLTREQAALILYRVFTVSPAVKEVEPFQDDTKIASWSKAAVYAMKEAGYVTGTPEGAFQPKKALTRAEAVKMINNVMGKLVADTGTHSDLAGKNLVVNTAGGTLSGVKLSGHLYITAGVGEGDLTIENAEIGGTIYVNGGGSHSIKLKNVKAGRIAVNKRSAPVRVALSGSSSVPAVDVISGAQVDNGTENPIESFNIEGANEVGVSGPVQLLNVNAAASLNVGESTIADLRVSSRAGGSRIALGAKAKVKNFTANAGATVTGEGEIGTATVNAPGVALAKKPGKLNLTAGEVKIGGETVTKGNETTTPPGTGTPGTGTPGTGTPGTETPGTETPGTETPGTETPGTENPGTETPGTENPGTGTPGTETPGTNPPIEQPTRLYSYDEALSAFAETGAEGLVKQYIAFIQDPTYKPSTANPKVVMPDMTNATTFVNHDFDIKPSIFASLRGVNTSVLNGARTTLWIGTDNGVTRISLANNAMKSYTTDNSQLTDNKVLLLIADGSTGVYAITKNGVSHIYQ
ncbi:S-layer homology domain-containing protein [Paenibacillus nasutitermitis]|uniref:SLH domain-containing protein n=1 Tax=Paenibacillus nasutitermitis TaxID=1652958 RepID=A0A917E050_9BACL|nr:S-layer homology domain-containing protein [Paenibacillus nasutitermitis]GGD86383.1 hypothetical protein GCM10010911_51060 [Paenibacillus nasutitermitis]